jgi:hypothetical protein
MQARARKKRFRPNRFSGAITARKTEKNRMKSVELNGIEPSAS